ncbi:S49 family peptidase [Aquisalimonas lutea]|uniref:S49 family peptidase n=1 Tax=Aquisalimonas lutea TaxID=1327750 RepID=UPI0025B60442|nr:S49 family peptidase [Aquisalimonas lutea]MDN3518466.1 S49 family peptidase [Aquisalimonas lutea]
MQDDRWERDALREVALEGIRERRRTRRWGIVFKSLFLAYLVFVLVLAMDWFPGTSETVEGPHAALVEVDGAIMPGGQNDAETVNRALRRAFENSGVRGVIVEVNSPGGSPVQASRINEEIRRLKQQYPETPLYVVAGDMFTSGAYYLAVSADRIYVDRATLVGSIGVLMNGFGFHEAMERLGIERRLYTAGENKAFMDPFSEEDPEDVERIKALLDDIHGQFINAVQQGRGDKLADNDELFSGRVWTGARSIELGLADEIGTTQHVVRDVIGVQETRDYTIRPSLLERFGRGIGTAVGETFARELFGPGQLR